MTQERNSIPAKNLSKAKEVILYILNKLGPIDESTLSAILYQMDFDHYEKYEEQLMGLTYQKIV